MGCQSLQEIFLTQGSKPGILHCRLILYHLHFSSLIYGFCFISTLIPFLFCMSFNLYLFVLMWSHKPSSNLPGAKWGSVQFSCSVVSNSLWPHGLQHARLPCPSPTPRAYSKSCPSPSPPAFNLSQHQGLFQWVSSLHQVAKGLEFQLQHQSFQWIFRTDFL